MLSMPRIVDADQRRAELTVITAREIARVGLERVTLRDIARAGGWSTGIVSHYFVDKRALLTATFRSRAALAGRTAAALIEAGATPLEAFVEAVLPLDDDRLLNWQVWLAFWGTAVGDPELSEAQRQRHDHFQHDLEQALRVEQEHGRLTSGRDLAHEARRLITVLDGVAVQVVFEPRAWPPDEQRRIVDEHLRGLRVDTPPRRTRAARPPTAAARSRR
jgi:AcrR family transcriptional regulator